MALFLSTWGLRASRNDIYLVAVIARDPAQAGRCIKRVRGQKLPKKYKQIPELKYHNSSQTIKERVLDCVARTDTDIAYAVLCKHQVYERLRNKQSILYNYIVGSLLLKIITAYQIEGTAKVFVDKSLYGLEKDHFDNYLTWKACVGNHIEELDIEPPEIIHVDSRLDRCIQVADFVAGAISHKYSSDDNHYCDKIKSRISISMDFFKGKDKDCVVNPSLHHPSRLKLLNLHSMIGSDP